MGEIPWKFVQKVIVSLAAFVLAVAIASMVVVSILMAHRWKLDATCDSHQTCVRDVSSSAGSVKICKSFTQPIDSTCDSECHVDGTVTKCTYDQQCTNADVTTCLGYCEITDADGSIYQGAHPDCDADKIAFKDFVTWNTSLSSDYNANWLYYSDYIPGDCFGATLGCTWYGAYIQLVSLFGTPTLWSTTTSASFTCLDFLNMSNSQCIQALEFALDENISVPLFQTAMSESTWKAQGKACIYYYQCAKVVNETALTDPAYLQGVKRRSLPSSSVTNTMMARFVDRMQASAPTIRQAWEPRVQRIKEEAERLKRVMSHY
jgi:hypothetical protein